MLAHKAENPRVFGSVATGTDDDESDLDLLIDPLQGMSFIDLNVMANELESLLGVSVDVITARSLNVRYRDAYFRKLPQYEQRHTLADYLWHLVICCNRLAKLRTEVSHQEFLNDYRVHELELRILELLEKPLSALKPPPRATSTKTA